MNKLTRLSLDTAPLSPIDTAVAPPVEWRRLRAYVLMLVIDAVLVHLGFALGSFLHKGVWAEPKTMLAAQTLLPVFFTIALYNATYGAHGLRNWTYAARRAVTALLISAALLNFVAFYTKSNAEFSRGSVTIGLLLVAISLVLYRRLIPVAVQRFWNGRTANQLVILDGGPDFPLANADIIAASAFDLRPNSDDPFMLDRLGKLLRHQDRVVVSTPRERRLDWAELLKSMGVRGEIVSEPAHQLGALGVNRYDREGVTTLVVSTGPLGLRQRIMKRLFDTVVAIAGLILLSPLFAYVALRIWMEDGGPIFFVQRRLGRGNRFFNVIKFRSMRVEKLDHNGDRSTGRDDDRITRFGAFIRRTSIDELPQLLNVLRGEMSIVGPRPHALGSQANNKYFWEVDAQYWQRHCLKPGLTGLAQVRGHRGATEKESDLTDRLASDLEYIAGWSLRRDIAIVLQTVMVLSHEKAF
jgi:exopolysaccharide biosynthesis polyprenyl glycosylphosphotransferase